MLGHCYQAFNDSHGLNCIIVHLNNVVEDKKKRLFYCYYFAIEIGNHLNELNDLNNMSETLSGLWD